MAERDNDGIILREFAEASKHLKDQPKSKRFYCEMRRLSRPFIDRLNNNGHDMLTSIQMLRKAFAHKRIDTYI